MKLESMSHPARTSTARRPADAELAAIRRIESILGALPPGRRDAVLQFILGRLDWPEAPAKAEG